ncbi:MAG: SpoIIE family protein phosphatase [Bacteroidetes bacterium]|nr:SpoIIE family protein phosphatase [Bacteroidota bacterium]
MKNIFLIFLTSLFFTDANAQSKIDTSQFKQSAKFIDKLLESNVDSSYSFIKQNLFAAKKQKYAYGYAKSNLQLARYYTLKGENDSSLLVTPIAIKYARISKDTALIINSYLFDARSLSSASKFNKAIEQCMQAQRFSENTQNYKLSVKVYHDLGYVYSNIGLHQQAINYYRKGLFISKQKEDTFNIANISGRIGGEFHYLNMFDSSLINNLNGLKHFKLIHHKRGIGATLVNLASTYKSLKQIDKAIETINQALIIRTELGDEYAITILKNNLVECYYDKKEYQYALTLAKDAELRCLKQNELQLIDQNYNNQFEIYQKLGNYQMACKYADMSLQLKDSIYQSTNLKGLNELQAKYESDKKEKEISLLQIEKKSAEEKSDADKKRRNLILISVITIAFLITIFAFILFKKFTESTRQKTIIQSQKQIVDEKNKEIIDSINYALTIQKAIIPSLEELQQDVKEAFVFFKPKDIVSGDFYWNTRVNDYLYFVVADCTGHGVPGAFMSLMAISYLSEIINEKKVLNTHEILNLLREKVILSLNKSSGSKGKRDGMDMVIIRINLKTLQLQFSGANNSIYILRGNQLEELKGNKMPVGLYTENTTDFTSLEMPLFANDKVIAFTDGLPDQFGGPKGKKFLYKRLENIICENCDLNLANLQEAISTSFETWKLNNEQVDDVTVLGIKI